MKSSKEYSTRHVGRISNRGYETVSFKNDETLVTFPLDFFRISDYFFKSLSKETSLCSGGFDDVWFSKKFNEYINGNKNGSFWESIKREFGKARRPIPNLEDLRPFNYDLNDLQTKELIYRRLLRERSGEPFEYDFQALVSGMKEAVPFIPECEGHSDVNRNEVASGVCVDNLKGNNMKIEKMKNVIVDEVKTLVNQSGAADIALGRILYKNIKTALGKTIVKISVLDRVVAKVSKKMKVKNEMTELLATLTMMVVLKQFYDDKALENVRGYIVNRLYTIGIEATGFDDVLALINQSETKEVING